MGNKGMMTVEASVVVPIILIIVVAEFFFGLFLIDMSVVKSETMRLADEAADVWKTDGKLADGTYKSQQLLLRNKNFLQKNRILSRVEVVKKNCSQIKYCFVRFL